MLKLLLLSLQNQKIFKPKMKHSKKIIINESVKKEFLAKFGKHLKELRTDKGISQAEFAEKCNSNRRKIGRTERGEYDFQITSLIVLAKGLDISIQKLLDFEYPENLFERFWIEKQKD